MSRAQRPSPAKGPPPAGSPVTAMLALPLLLLLVVPVVILIIRISPRVLAEELACRETLSAIALSLVSCTVALVVSLVLGTPLAYWLARSQSRFAALAETLVDLRTVLPPSVAGVALLLALGRNGPIGGLLDSAGLSLAFTPAAVVIAQVFVSSPYYVRAARAGLASIQPDVRESAIIDGASNWRLFRDVLAPQAAPSLFAGAAMCWSRAIGEFGATIIFAGNLPGRTQTMPLAIYLGIENGLDRALVLATVLIGLSLIILLGVRMMGWRIPGPLG